MAETKEMIVNTFKKFDLNQDGVISKEELGKVLCAIAGDQFDDKAVDALLQASDTNKDGKIQYEEFVNWVTQDLKNQPPPASDKFAPLDKRGEFHVDYRKLLPERFQVDVKDRYDLDKLELGAGGFGKVFIARDREFKDRRVAVKKVPKPGRGGSDLSDLEREIQVMKELDHPNICKLLATFEEGRNMFFIMELCEGGEVFDRIIERGSMSERTTSIIIAQVAQALSYAHARGIAHRDIKPENIVFCSKDREDLRIKLIDWGLATNFEAERMTKAVGSMTYAAPEVISSQDRKAYTQACDLWSIGVLAYVMLSGKPPFWGSREQHYKAAKNERYPFKDDPWDRINPDAKDFVRNLLKAKPEERTPIDKCVQHPWLASPPDEKPAAETDSVVANLKNFCAQSTFSRMCITAVARQLDHQHLKDIHQVFRDMDKDGNGTLSVEEVTEGLKLMGGETMDVATLFQHLDMDGSATIDYTEFCAAGLGAKTSMQDDVIWAAFKTFDIDNTGFISVDNITAILDSADVKDSWSAEVCKQVGEEIVTKFSSSGTGKISFEDWQKVMQQCWSKSSLPSNDGIHAYDLLQKVGGLS